LGLLFPLFGQQTITGTLVHDNLTRNYRLRLPKDFQKSEMLPLVFNFHGFTSNATQQELYSGMNAVADRERFAVCYPNGVGAAWNVGWSFGSQADDVGFVEAMIEKFADEYGLDRNKIYACGMSNGGFFSYHLACKLTNKIAAIASVTGSMVPGSLENCQPSSTIPVMEIHGTADDVVAYNGTANVSLPIDSVMAFWSSHNQCDGTVLKENIPNTNTTDQSTVEKYTFTDCENNHTVVLFKVLGGGHTWPGAVLNVGVTNRDIISNEEIWNFFKKYSLPSTNATNDISTEIRIFPNPVFDNLTIETSYPVSRVDIFSFDGKKISETTTGPSASSWIQIPVGHLINGLYTVSINQNGVSSFHRFIKM
jgi:polyhydroxybutyrate depolymerase